jgi:hypothetical protein
MLWEPHQGCAPVLLSVSIYSLWRETLAVVGKETPEQGRRWGDTLLVDRLRVEDNGWGRQNLNYLPDWSLLFLPCASKQARKVLAQPLALNPGQWCLLTCPACYVKEQGRAPSVDHPRVPQLPDRLHFTKLQKKKGFTAGQINSLQDIICIPGCRGHCLGIIVKHPNVVSPDTHHRCLGSLESGYQHHTMVGAVLAWVKAGA